MSNPSLFHRTDPQPYKGFYYWIAGRPEEYRFTVETFQGGRVFTSDRYPMIVTANQEARHRIDLVTVVLEARA